MGEVPSEERDEGSHKDSGPQRRALGIAFLLNLVLASSLVVSGVLGDSSGLIANGLDNLSDAAVYALGYFAATHGAVWKTRAARLSGIMLAAGSSSRGCTCEP